MSENQNSNTTFHPNAKDITGKKFNYLTVVRKVGKDIHRNLIWECLCECGVIKPVNGLALRQGKIKSCGCKTKEMIGAANTIHGEHGCRTYSCWMNMRSRAASNKTLIARKYAKMDITICDRWSSYQLFLEDMGHCPSDKHTIDRKDNDLGYSKENCRWATQTEQQRNKSSNKIIEYRGKKMCVAEFAELIGFPYRIVAERIRDGWTIERVAHTIPKQTPNA